MQSSRGGTRPAWPGHRVPATAPSAAKCFALRPPRCKPGAGWGLALPSSSPLQLPVPGAGVPSGSSSAPSFSLNISSGQLFPIPPSQSYHWTGKSFVMQNRTKKSRCKGPGEAFPQGAWPGCSGCTKKLPIPLNRGVPVGVQHLWAHGKRPGGWRGFLLPSAEWVFPCFLGCRRCRKPPAGSPHIASAAGELGASRGGRALLPKHGR